MTARDPLAARPAAEGILAFDHPVGFPPGSQTAYALEDADESGAPAWTVLDPGLAATEPLWRARLAAPDGPLRGLPVWRVIATHHHPDHIGLAGWLQREAGASLWTTRTAWLHARMLQLDAWETPPFEAETFMRRAGYDAAMLERWRVRARINFSVTVAPMPLGYRRIAAGDEISIGGRRWRVLIGEGHAPEHALLLCEEERLLLGGDHILPDVTPNIGVYPTEPDGDPLGEWLQSCAALAGSLDPAFTVLPGHGAPFEDGPARLRRYLAKHEDALRRLEALLAEPRSLVACWPALYRRPIQPPAEGLATVEAAAHLNHLVRTGRAVRELGDDGADRYRRAA